MMQRKLISLILIFIFYVFSLKISFSLTSCQGLPTLTLTPSHGFTGDMITASISGMKGEDCLDRIVHIRKGNCQGLEYCDCRLNRMSGNVYGCSCNFRAPSIPYTSEGGISRQWNFTYYACIDLNDDGTYDEALGEQSHKSLLVYSRVASLSLVTESVVIIITLGILLAVIIVLFRRSFKRK